MEIIQKIGSMLLLATALAIQITGGWALGFAGMEISMRRPNPALALVVVLNLLAVIFSKKSRAAVSGFMANLASSRRKHIFFAILIAAIILLVFAGAAFPEIGIFDLDREDALGTYLSGFLLVTASAFAFAGGWLRDERKLRWYIVAGLFAAMTIDELTSIHESVPRRFEALGLELSSTGGLVPWTVLLAPVIIAAAAYLLWFGWKLGKKARPVAMVGVACYLAAISLEQLIMGFHIPVAECVAEESMELVGSLMFALSFALSLPEKNR